jgi:hypothetical protein
MSNTTFRVSGDLMLRQFFSLSICLVFVFYSSCVGVGVGLEVGVGGYEVISSFTYEPLQK